MFNFRHKPALGLILLGAAIALPVPTHAQPAAPIGRALSGQERAGQFFRQGQLNYEKGHYEAAIDRYSEAIGLYPDYIAAYAARGRVLGIVEDYEGAIADYTSAIELDPELAAAYGGRGLARFRNGEVEAGIDDLWQASQLFDAQGERGHYLRTIEIISRLAP